jgi:broad specificity phosphatase PhoE
LNALHLTLLCHPRTASQRAGRLASPEDLPLALPSVGSDDFSRIVSAPEIRACQAAGVFGAFEVQPALADCNLGCWAGVPLKRLQAEHAQALHAWLNDPSFNGHGGESLDAVRRRVGQWLDSLEGRTGRWLAVTHPWVIRAAAGQVLGLGYQAMLALDVQPGARVTLAWSDRWRLVFG